MSAHGRANGLISERRNEHSRYRSAFQVSAHAAQLRQPLRVCLHARKLMDVAENERMRQMTSIRIAQPSGTEPVLIILAQRVVGYLEEEACLS